MTQELSSSIPFARSFDSIPFCEDAISFDNFSHRVFVTTNEAGIENVLEDLSSFPLEGNTLVAVSGFYALNLAAVRGLDTESKRGFENILVIDRSVRVQHFWAQIKEKMPTFSSRFDAINATKNLLEEHKNIYYSEGRNVDREVGLQIGGLEEEIESGVSWLSSDKKFLRIKEIFDKHHFAFVLADLVEEETIKKIGEILKQRQWTVDTIYLSNFIEYFGGDEELEDASVDALAHLIDPDTFIVLTLPRCSKRCSELTQTIDRLGSRAIKDLFPNAEKREALHLLCEKAV